MQAGLQLLLRGSMWAAAVMGMSCAYSCNPGADTAAVGSSFSISSWSSVLLSLTVGRALDKVGCRSRALGTPSAMLQLLLMCSEQLVYGPGWAGRVADATAAKRLSRSFF